MKNANCPASPLPNPDLTEATQYQGLSKRERFAEAAMQELIATNATYNGEEDKGLLAKDAVQHADFLLAELENTEES